MLTHPVAHYRCRRGSVGSHPNRLPRQSLHPAMHCIHRHNASAARSRTGPCIKVIAHRVDGCLRTNPTAAHCMSIAARELLQIFDVIRVKRTAPRYASHSPDRRVTTHCAPNRTLHNNVLGVVNRTARFNRNKRIPLSSMRPHGGP